MLTTPKHGWAHIQLLEWSDRLSYLDDVPFMLLNALYDGCYDHKPVSVKFDAEGYEYILVFEWKFVYVIYQDSSFLQHFSKDTGSEEMQIIKLHISREAVCRELIQDIRNDVKEWASFYYDVEDPITAEERQKELLNLCDSVEALLPADDYKLVYRNADLTDSD